MDIKRGDFDVYCGIDVGKAEHAVCAIAGTDEEVFFKASIANSEADIREVFAALGAAHRVLVAFDQKGDMARLAIKIAQCMGIATAFLTPHDFHLLSGSYSEIKTDPHDAFVIADIALRMGRVLHLIESDDERIETLRLLVRERAGVVADMTRTKNRIHSLLLATHPPFARFVRQQGVDTPYILAILAHYGGPCSIRRAGERRLTLFVSKLHHYTKKGHALAVRVFAALQMQSTCLGGSKSAEELISRHALALTGFKEELKKINARIAGITVKLPEVGLLQSMPGIGEVYSAVIVSEVADISRFKDAGHLAAYAGVAPSKRQSGKTLNTAKKKRKCNKVLKSALCQSAWLATEHDVRAKGYYDKKRGEGKSHTQALIALARHRTDTIYAMLKTGSVYEP